MRRFLLTGLACLTLTWPLSATWSICVVNRRTGEVAVASATCIPNGDLMVGLPVVRVGEGVGAIQSSGWAPGLRIMYDLFPTSATPTDILDAVRAAAPSPGQLQMGTASMSGPAATFTGGNVGQAKGGVVGEVGDLSYAIQGNVLSGSNVWFDCEAALLSTPGDLAAKLMAAMEAAYMAGGDGRCSCDTFQPTSCGSPPPNFTKTAHIGFMIVSRIGDTNPTCSPDGRDCANDGLYHMKFNVRGRNAQPQDPDPVLQLREKYDNWRLLRAGEPDGILSTVNAVQSLPADGVTQRTVEVQLVDLEGVPLTEGGDNLVVSTVQDGGSGISVGPVTDHGDGSYSFALTAGTSPGVERFAITADMLTKRATLYPYLEVRSDPRQGLHAGYDEISASERACVPFVLDEPDHAGETYLLAASLGGTQPGWTILGTNVPLNPPLYSVLSGVASGRLPNSLGVLDVDGRAEAAFLSDPMFLMNLAGRRVDWAAMLIGPGGVAATNAVGFDIVP